MLAGGGVININKPVGMTSHDVVYRVRRLLGIKKVGHTGTLDPDASGVLPICTGKGTKLSGLLVDFNKRYTAKFKLGVTTATEDASGEILETNDVNVSESEIKDVILEFVGVIEQIPPMYSAVKIDGQKLYNLARKGINIERPARKIEIFDIKILEIELPYVKIDVSCSKGTYIRTLCADIGKRLSCGAHMTELERTQSGCFCIEQSIALDELTPENINDFIMPSDSFFDCVSYTASEDEKAKVLCGIPLRADISDFEQRKIFDGDGNFLCLSEAANGSLVMKYSFFEV